jgi:hypothetical protein
LEDRAARLLVKQTIKTMVEPVGKRAIKKLYPLVTKLLITQVLQEAQRRPPPVLRRPLREQVVKSNLLSR